jgi:hypothetical protein
MEFSGGIVVCSSKLTKFTGETLAKTFHLSLFLLVSTTEVIHHAFPSTEPTPPDPIQTQRALATVQAILQASNCPQYTRDAWLYLKKRLLELSTTPATSVHNEILKRLSAIEKKLSAPAALTP